MSKLIDLTGQKFGRLTVIRRAENAKNGKSRWKCICDCGDEKVLRGEDLRMGKIMSCGCLLKESSAKRMQKLLTKHGQAGTRLYRVWTGMKQRCYDTKIPYYKNYGGRGITICDEWLHDFQVFYDWSMANGYDETAPKGQCTLDRIDNNLGYSPSNCRWATRKEQQNNTRRNYFIEYKGQQYTISQLGKKLGIAPATLSWRLHNGWGIDELELKADLNNTNVRKGMMTY